MIPIEHILVFSGALFALGLYTVLARRHAVLVIMGVELMLNAVSLNLVAFAVYGDPERFLGQIFAIFVITVAAAEVGLALAIVLRMFRLRATANVDDLDALKW
jgi:NADH:ubiquinone oxidoreductase subunit K